MSALLWTPGASAVTGTLAFDGSSSDVDGHPGVAGDVWVGGWTHAGSGTPTIVNTSPLNASGNYLSVGLTGGDQTVRRQLDETAIDLTAAHTITWDWRLDADFTAGSQDRINFFANGGPAGSTSGSNAWIIGAAGQMGFGNNFYLYNRLDGGFNAANAIDTGIAVVSGQTYSFSVSVDPTTSSYGASISGNGGVFNASNLAFRNGSAGLDYLHFGTRDSTSGSPRTFSLDNLAVTGFAPPPPPPVDNSVGGYHGIWYSIGQSTSFGPKYAGGLATYPQQSASIAEYSAAHNKTFFVYGGTDGQTNSLNNMIGYFDHATGEMGRPQIIRDVGGTNIHQSATLNIDKDGYLWVFAHSHGTQGDGNLYRSDSPGDISAFTEVDLPGGLFSGGTDLAYGNSLYDADDGFVEV